MAIKERREITFDADEVYAALQNINRDIASKIGLPSEWRAGIEFDFAEGFLLVHSKANANGPAFSLRLDGIELAVFMMEWCRVRKVPLPRNGNKSVRVVNQTLVLSLSSTLAIMQLGKARR